MCFSVQCLVQGVPSGQAEGCCREMAIRRTVLSGTASGCCTHRLLRSGIHSQLSGATGPEKKSVSASLTHAVLFNTI